MWSHSGPFQKKIQCQIYTGFYVNQSNFRFLNETKAIRSELHICAGAENSTASNSMKQREQERNRSVQIGTLNRSLASRHQNRQERPNTDPAPQLFAMTNSRTHLSLFTTDLATTFSGYFCSHGKSPV